MKFRKKPDEVEALQFTGKHSLVDIIEIFGAQDQSWYYSEDNNTLKMPHGETYVFASKGDWIIKDGDKFYPCSKQAFELLYEPITCSKEMTDEPAIVAPGRTSDLYCVGCGKPKVLCLGGTSGCSE